MSKKIVLLVASALFLFTGTLSFSVFADRSVSELLSASKKPKVNADGTVVEGPKTEACPLNGKLYSKERKAVWESRRPMGVMIENHTEARPQSGLTSADVVYEAVAEGGITRFLSIFYCDDAKYIGPVRSARMYFLKLLQGYGDHPLYAHVGGANTPGPADALGEIADLGWDHYNDLNQFAVPFPYYYRDYDRNPGVATEHTMYSSTEKLYEYAAKQRKLTNKDADGTPWDRGFTPWKFKDGKAVASPDATKISYHFWSKFDGDNYAVSWSYDPTTNTYSRSNGGAPHIDHNTGKAIAPTDVVIMYADERPANDGYEGGHMLYGVVGSGKAIIFQNGTVMQGSWSKPKEENMVTFKSGGKEVEFARGQIWVSVLPTGDEVTY